MLFCCICSTISQTEDHLVWVVEEGEVAQMVVVELVEVLAVDKMMEVKAWLLVVEGVD